MINQYNYIIGVILMTISKNKTRTIITIEKSVKEELTRIAKEENRSLNNLIETILKEYLANKN
jgi:hypothetical protein